MADRLQGKKVAIFAEDHFEDSELIEPLKYMKNLGAEVVIVGSGRSQVFHGKRGASITVDIDASAVQYSDFDAFIVPGGYAPDKMRKSKKMIALIAEADDAGKVIAAICHGPQLLISADILRGRMATSVDTVAVDVTNAGAHYFDDAVVVDGNIITSRTPNDLPQFNEAIAAALLSHDQAANTPMVAGA